MGEIFRREAATNPEEFTGERLTSALAGQTQIEHYHRYLVARSFCPGLDVLDVASGEGYGSAQLAQVARSVIGVEYSASTVKSATDNFGRSNLNYVQGDARALPLRDASFDLVVSFETIEHFHSQEAFLSEVHRVSRPGGLVIISTPDRDVYSPAGVPPNEFHVKELSRSEFVAMLRRHFDYVEFFLQRPLIGSAMIAETANAIAPLIYDRRGKTHFEACASIPRAPYLIAIAANRPLPPLPVSLFIERSDLDSDRIALAERIAELDTLRRTLATARVNEHAIEIALTEANTRAVALTARVADLEQELAATKGSMRTFLRSYLPRLKAHLIR